MELIARVQEKNFFFSVFSFQRDQMSLDDIAVFQVVVEVGFRREGERSSGHVHLTATVTAMRLGCSVAQNIEEDVVEVGTKRGAKRLVRSIGH